MEDIPISINDMADHFRKLCSGPTPPHRREEELHTEQFIQLTDSSIDVDETARAIKKQKGVKPQDLMVYIYLTQTF